MVNGGVPRPSQYLAPISALPKTKITEPKNTNMRFKSSPNMKRFAPQGISVRRAVNAGVKLHHAPEQGKRPHRHSSAT